MKRYYGPRPWAIRTLAAVLLLVFPVLYAVAALIDWVDCGKELLDHYWTAFKTGRLQ